MAKPVNVDMRAPPPELLRRQRSLGRLDDGAEGVGIAHGQVGQHLAVDPDAGQGKAVDQAGIGRPFSRDAALMRMIQSRRKSRLRFLRSR